jgi:hypothetical protein
MFEKYVGLIDRPPAPRKRGTLKKNLALKFPVYGGFRGRFQDVSDCSDIHLGWVACKDWPEVLEVQVKFPMGVSPLG